MKKTDLFELDCKTVKLSAIQTENSPFKEIIKKILELKDCYLVWTQNEEGKESKIFKTSQNFEMKFPFEFEDVRSLKKSKEKDIES